MEKYVGIALIIVCVGIVILALAAFGYNTYISATKEKIEVHAQNSNFTQDKVTKKDE